MGLGLGVDECGPVLLGLGAAPWAAYHGLPLPSPCTFEGDPGRGTFASASLEGPFISRATAPPTPYG